VSRVIQGMTEGNLVAALDAARAPVDRGEPDTLESLFRDHHLTVARWAAHLGGPEVDPEDIVQEVFLIVRAQLHRYVPQGKITTWLYRLTEYTVRAHRRRARIRRFLGGDPRGVAERYVARALEPLDILEQREERALLYRALDRLPEKHRTVIILFELEELSGEEIAERLAIKPSTVWVWLHRGRRELLARLRRSGAECGGER
jgi:RNA polymerase sigma-70 factor (ECF subfamily)